MGGPGPAMASRLPIVKPPYGRITAYNMNTGDIAWMIPNGDTPPNIKSNPALAGINIPRTGSPSQAGLLVTKTLLIAGEGSGGQPVLHAYDKATGADVWQTALPGPQTSLPMTYMANGRQFIVMGVRGAQGGAAQLVAFAIPLPAPPGGGRGRGAGPGAPAAGNNQ
jgi:glucose dehydrogenase